jgi:glucose-1-phosphate cytidylyltransferase
MKVVLLAGGLGTRLSEETDIKPKPMIEIGGKPILWHIMKIYSHFGFNEFIVCLGYKGYIVKEYFANYFLHQSDVTIDTSNNSLEIHNSAAENWKITLVDTGKEDASNVFKNIPIMSLLCLLMEMAWEILTLHNY